jgi:hypothetical protein
MVTMESICTSSIEALSVEKFKDFNKRQKTSKFKYKAQAGLRSGNRAYAKYQ